MNKTATARSGPARRRSEAAGRGGTAPGPSRAGRPTRSKSAEKRASILEASGSLFLEHGLQATSMDGVASRAGVSKQTVYSHFESKEALFRACIEDKLERYALTDFSRHADLPIEEALERIARNFLDLVYDPDAVKMHRCVVAEAGEHPQIAKLFHDAGPGTGMAAMTIFLTRRMEADELAIDDPERAAAEFFTLLKGERHMSVMLNLAKTPGARERARDARRVVGQFLKLYGSDSPGT